MFVEELWSQSSKWYQTWDNQLLYSRENGVRWAVILYRKSMGSVLVVWILQRFAPQNHSHHWCNTNSGHLPWNHCLTKAPRNLSSTCINEELQLVIGRPLSIETPLNSFKNRSHISSAECKKVVRDIFGKIEFLMEYENIGLYAHFALFSRFLTLLFSKILSKMCSKTATYDPIALTFDKCV